MEIPDFELKLKVSRMSLMVFWISNVVIELFKSQERPRQNFSFWEWDG